MNVRYIHLRRPLTDTTPAGRGGLTICYYEDAKDCLRYTIALCSDEDNFSKAIGRKISLDRLRHDHNNKYWNFFDGDYKMFHHFIIHQAFAGEYKCYSKPFQSS